MNWKFLFWCWLLMAACVVMLIVHKAHAKDGWEGRPLVCDMANGPRLEACQAWISTVQRPDVRGASCCGVADAYMTDDFWRDPATGDLYAVFSMDYPVDPNTGAGGYKKGDKILVPNEKRNFLPEDANRSGHGVTFIAGGAVICWFAPPLT